MPQRATGTAFHKASLCGSLFLGATLWTDFLTNDIELCYGSLFSGCNLICKADLTCGPCWI